MGFELHIECSKDIDELHINFSDGTSAIKTKPSNPSNPKNPKKKLTPKESKQQLTPKESKSNQMQDFLDTNADFDGVQQEVIKPPEIIREPKDIKVAEELQNLDI